jgi:hypothetical protein
VGSVPWQRAAASAKKNKGEMIRVSVHGWGELKREQAAASATTPASGQLT